MALPSRSSSSACQENQRRRGQEAALLALGSMSGSDEGRTMLWGWRGEVEPKTVIGMIKEVLMDPMSPHGTLCASLRLLGDLALTCDGAGRAHPIAILQDASLVQALLAALQQTPTKGTSAAEASIEQSSSVARCAAFTVARLARFRSPPHQTGERAADLPWAAGVRRVGRCSPAIPW